ncbi:hypothetical protein IJS77_03805, partial [bacterium]|nr:hypothetical protein [bacterium]
MRVEKMTYAKDLSALIKTAQKSTFLKTYDNNSKTSKTTTKTTTVDDKYDENDFYNGTIKISDKNKGDTSTQKQVTKTLKSLLNNLNSA